MPAKIEPELARHEATDADAAHKNATRDVISLTTLGQQQQAHDANLDESVMFPSSSPLGLSAGELYEFFQHI